jgi:hypothetical protein
MVVASLALFVALGGPAQARRLINGADIKKGTVRSAQIKDHGIIMRDLNPTVVRQLRLTPDRSIADRMLLDGAVTATKLGNGAVTGAKLADGAVTGAKIADGSLTAADVARFAGRFRIAQKDLGTIARHSCLTREPQGLAPELAGADISQDALVVTPVARTIDERLSLTATTSGSAQPSRFVLTICNGTDEDVPAPPNGITFSYVVFDVP